MKQNCQKSIDELEKMLGATFKKSDGEEPDEEPEEVIIYASGTEQGS